MKRDLPRLQPELPHASDVIHPHTGSHNGVERMFCSPSARAASAADLAPPPPRPGSLTALDCPSRIGDQLHYRNGRITDLAGNPVN